MNLIEAITKAKTEFDLSANGFISVNDDNEIFWSNMRPSIQDGYWGSNSRGYMTEYVGMYTGTKIWTRTLRELS